LVSKFVSLVTNLHANLETIFFLTKLDS